MQRLLELDQAAHAFHHRTCLKVAYHNQPLRRAPNARRTGKIMQIEIGRQWQLRKFEVHVAAYTNLLVKEKANI